MTETPTIASCAGGTPRQYVDTVTLTVSGTAASTTFDVFVQPVNIIPAGTFVKVGTLTTDAAGNATFTGQATVTANGFAGRAVVRLVAVAPPTAGSIDTSATTTIVPCGFGSGIASYTVTQQPTPATCAGGTPPQYIERLALQLVDYQPTTTYDVYITADAVTPAGRYTKVGSFTTDARGAATFAGTVTLTLSVAGYPTSLDVNIVYSGASATPPVAYHDLTTLTNLPC